MPRPDDLLFGESPTAAQPTVNGRAAGVEPDYWTVLIVDDEEEVHHVTRLVLRGFSYKGKGLQCRSAYSAVEAMQEMRETPDIAVVLLDVVMEENDSGLKVVRFIREELRNKLMRIILRTGQPGQAPEEKVIVEYDINDYKEKTEITAQKLFTVMVSALRTYNDMLTIEANRQGLEQIIGAASDIFQLNSMEKFTSGVLSQLVALLDLKRDALYCQASSFAATDEEPGLVIKAASGKYEQYLGKKVEDVPDVLVRQSIDTALLQRHDVVLDKSRVEYFESKTGSKSVIYFEEYRPLTDLDNKLIDIFFANVSIGFDNIYLNMAAEEKARLAQQAQYAAEKASLEVVRQIAQRAEGLQKISRAVAHQLRNPMTILAGFANLLGNKPELRDKYGEYFDGIKTAAERIEKLTNAVIEYTSIHIGETHVCSLPLFLEEVRKKADVIAGEQGKSIVWSVTVEPLSLRIDTASVSRALLEVLANSIEAIAEQQGAIRITAERREDKVALRIWDNGRGIPDNELAYVLDPFYTTKAVGIGMGLSTADRIVQEHNGSLFIASQPGVGTTVEIMLPLEHPGGSAEKAGVGIAR